MKPFLDIYYAANASDIYYAANVSDIFPCEVLIYDMIQHDDVVGGNEDTRKHRLRVGHKGFYFLSSKYLKWC